jgi:hypothetical protein
VLFVLNTVTGDISASLLSNITCIALYSFKLPFSLAGCCLRTTEIVYSRARHGPFHRLLAHFQHLGFSCTCDTPLLSSVLRDLFQWRYLWRTQPRVARPAHGCLGDYCNPLINSSGCACVGLQYVSLSLALARLGLASMDLSCQCYGVRCPAGLLSLDGPAGGFGYRISE